MRRARLAPALIAIVALAVPAAAGAQTALPPSLAIDTSYAFNGVSGFDFTPGAVVAADDAAGAAADSSRDRLYAVGTTSNGQDLDVAVVARRASGLLNADFAGDGALAQAVATDGDDTGADMVVLPDGRLRIVGSTDTGVAPAGDVDVLVLGLLPDGKPDPGFGTAGVVTFPVGAAAVPDAATSVAVDATGRLAITGTTGTGTAQSTFVAVREPDGTAAAFGSAGVATVDRALGAADHGADVVWGANGPVALIGLGTPAAPAGAALHALTATGQRDTTFSDDGDLELAPGGTASTAGALTVAAGRLWATGSTRVGSDVDAFLERVAPDGTDDQSRRFDMRGSTFAGAEAVASRGLAITVAPGEPDTLVVAGSAATDRGSEVGAAAFNLLDGPVAGLQATDLVVRVEGQGAAVGLSPAGPNAVALTASLLDFSLETGSGSNDTSIGMGRVLVDAEKRCDLNLAITSPLELRMSGRRAGTVALRVVNNGQRACGGTITAAEPFTLASQPLSTGKLAPGGSTALTASVSYVPTALPERSGLALTLTAPEDIAPGDNAAALSVRFAYCNIGLRRFSGPAAISTEGTVTMGFSIRNRGTAACRSTGIRVALPGVRTDKRTTYTVPAGQSVTEEVTLRLPRKTPAGRRLNIAYAVAASGDVTAADNTLSLPAVTVRPGDTNAATPRDGRTLSGRASAGRAAGVARRSLRVARVQVAVRFIRGRRAIKGCRWLADPRGRTRRMTPGAKGRCDAPVWIDARGTSRWSLKLARRLPAGRYQLLSRAVLRNGVTETVFSASDRNTRPFRVSRRTSRR